ncbi:TetR/AcrR family transcriptional regulator [Rhodococcus triatomae]|uniref:DNA-binding transcriptional regulator, AcrR family n=1 Tax=Rhodococcus triatomae TaxID=300028 RepID=A0A1G8DWH5_9NOCA|nr:TetR/AcrR family transcriptional regulator [Rhodococcus triatomae]QNG18333.1 TetR/AcrR family transcriptional regulator [Rhodococcus triatomae]QNG21997.1 TetR/AcrR family transcriptional regulator [Rhodococcus triatomae]SDH61800.1 DNA-binding transcriptional regulator, AcrR family [Rhodococcus triatomae]
MTQKTQKAAARRKRPTQARAVATRELILETATRLFGERGVADTSTNRIATTAGISIGTLYRYFNDRSEIVSELLDRVIRQVESAFADLTPGVPGMTGLVSVDSATEVVSATLAVSLDVLVDNAALIEALVGEVQFYSSGLPELESRLRMLFKVIIIQLIGPVDHATLETMTSVLINTGFAGVLRASARDVDPEERDAVIAMTSRMLGTWLYSEVRW